MSSFWNWATSSNSNYAMDVNEPEPEPKPKTPRYGQKLETKARIRPKQTQNDDYLISSISESILPRNFEGSRNINDRLPFQDSLTARMPKSIKEAEKNRK